MNRVRGYIFSRPFMGERVPQHIQNLVIREYCERNDLQFLLSATEYAMKGSQLVLQQLLMDTADVSGLIAYSVFQLPEHRSQRADVYRKIYRARKALYFAVEGLCARTEIQFDQIETLWQIKETMPYCVQLKDLT